MIIQKWYTNDTFYNHLTWCFVYVGKTLVAYYDHHTSAVRHVSCLWVSDSHHTVELCYYCYQFQRNTLNSAFSTERKRLAILSPGRTSVQSHTNYRDCSSPEILKRTANVKHTATVQKKKTTDRLKQKIDDCVQTSGVDVEEEIVATAASSWGRQWHPLVIKWCLHLHHLSSKSYETIRNSGILTLPSSQTLRYHTHLHSTKVGFSIEPDRQLRIRLAESERWLDQVGSYTDWWNVY